VKAGLGDPFLSTENNVYNVLFLCTGNSARSVMAEAILNRIGRGRFRAFSAGSFPKGEVHPLALELLRRERLASEGLRSKSWDEFAEPGAPELDFVFTLCDQAAAEACPVWPGQPITAHWGFPDPAAVEGSEAEKLLFFGQVYREIASRLAVFTSLPVASLDRLTLKARLDEIGQPHLKET
jgi:protein-tyrosine-phosphatase